VVELMEEHLEQAALAPEELSARAAELRVQAEQTDIEGYREASLETAHP
jgi:hypothetical protein